MKELLGELHEELGSGGELDAETAEKLAVVRNDIGSYLEDDSSHEPANLADRTRDLIQHFEADHPTLTAVVNRIADALAGMGI